MPKPPSAEDNAADRAWREHAWRQQISGRERLRRALAWGTVVALVSSLLSGMLRVWVWIPLLEPLAIGVVIGEAAAVPSSVRERRPPGWTYLYLFAVGAMSYLLIHVAFWLASTGFTPAESFAEFVRGVSSGTAARLFEGLGLVRAIGSGPEAADAIQYRLCVLEGLLMGSAGALAYRGGSVRRLRA